ncbi:MAG: hypothetical protein AAGA30_18060, partial [Planctomycetota bacterium]
MYFSPTDEEIEIILGAKLGSWRANPDPIVASEFDQAAKPENPFLRFFLICILFSSVALLAYLALVYFKSTIAGSLAILISGAVGLLIHNKIRIVAHSRATLGVFEKGLRLGSSIYSFDELSAITLGAPESFEEKYFPTLKQAGNLVAEIKVGTEQVRQAQYI